MEESNRMKRLGLYLFTIIDNLKREAIEKGMELIDLGMGNPAEPAPEHVIKELCKRAQDPRNHGYSRSIDGSEVLLRQAIAKWYKKKFGVNLDPEANEVVPLIGAKEGIAHLALAFLNSDDVALVPSPAYPVHFNGVLVAGGILHNVPMKEEDGFLPDFETVPADVLKKTKMLFISYPHNPTTATASIPFYKKVVAFAKKHNIILVSDITYSDMVFDGHRAPSVLEVEGAKDVAVEFHSWSKSYNMAGWRLGMAVGNGRILRSLSKIKGYMDFGLFKPIQYAGIAALMGSQKCVDKQVALYKKRRDIFIGGLAKAGWNIPNPRSTMYVWARIPDKYSALTSMEYTALMLKETGVVSSPGTGFGEYGEGFIRFALVQPEKQLVEACKRIKKFLEMET